MLKNNPKIEQAKFLYMTKYMTVSEIGETCGVHQTQISRWIKSFAWDIKRQQQSLDMAEKVKTIKHKEISEIFQISLPMVKQALLDRAKSDKEISLREASAIVEIVTNLDKLMRLDTGQATEIIQANFKPITIEELKNAIKKDPFIDIKDSELIDDNSRDADRTEDEGDLVSTT